jgi:hypothetical protein
MLSFCAVPDSLKLKIKESFPEATFFIPEEPKTPRKREKKPKKVKDMPKLESPEEPTSDSSV